MPMVSADGARILPFNPTLPFDVGTLEDISAATDPDMSYLAVSEVDGSLRVYGVFMYGTPTPTRGVRQGLSSLCIRGVEPGRISVSWMGSQILSFVPGQRASDLRGLPYNSRQDQRYEE